MIPSQWEKIVLYAEILDNSADIYFYFTTPNNSDYLYSNRMKREFLNILQLHRCHYLRLKRYSRPSGMGA